MDKTPAREGKREKIMAAAVQVFARTGYHDTKIEDVAVAAGIGKGTVYEYFDSKLHLFQELMNRSVSMYYNNISAETQKAMSFRDRITHLLESHFLFYKQEKDITRILFWDTEYMDRDLRDWGCRMRQEKEARLREWIEQSIARGEVRALDPQFLTLTLMGITSSLFMPVVLGEMDIDPHAAALAFTDIVLNGVGIASPDVISEPAE